MCAHIYSINIQKLIISGNGNTGVMIPVNAVNVQFAQSGPQYYLS